MNKKRGSRFDFRTRMRHIATAKRSMELEMLVWWVIAFFILVVAVVGIIILRGKGFSALDFIKNLFRFK